MIPLISSKELDGLRLARSSSDAKSLLYFIDTKYLSKKDLEDAYEIEVLPMKKLLLCELLPRDFPIYLGSYLEEYYPG